MIAIDTNILVRYITQDDEIQSKTAEDLLSEYDGKPQSIFMCAGHDVRVEGSSPSWADIERSIS